MGESLFRPFCLLLGDCSLRISLLAVHSGELAGGFQGEGAQALASPGRIPAPSLTAGHLCESLHFSGPTFPRLHLLLGDAEDEMRKHPPGTGWA